MASVAQISERLEAPLSLDDPGLYLDPEISLLAFQRRVLEEARDPGNPLLARVKFLSILFSNLDEFFMVHVAVLKRKGDSGLPAGSAVESERIAAACRGHMSD